VRAAPARRVPGRTRPAVLREGVAIGRRVAHERRRRAAPYPVAGQHRVSTIGAWQFHLAFFCHIATSNKSVAVMSWSMLSGCSRRIAPAYPDVSRDDREEAPATARASCCQRLRRRAAALLLEAPPRSGGECVIQPTHAREKSRDARLHCVIHRRALLSYAPAVLPA